MSRIYLSPPDVGEIERECLLAAFDSNWIAPLGPHVDEFEQEFARLHGVPEAAALSSGTAALHLALRELGVGRDDEVLVPTLTFVATANVVAYVGAQPIFLDCDETSWNLDPGLLEEELTARARDGRLPAAVIGVDLYGQCADWRRIQATCDAFEVPTIEDAAEALGATCDAEPAGTLADIGVFSFNGNKIITTSGGGMLISSRPHVVEHVRRVASQARDPSPHYEHSELGFNYRLSNLLASLGLGQLRRLPDMIHRRREINRQYREALTETPGIAFMPTAPYGEPTCWLTVVTIEDQEFGASRDDVIKVLAAHDIEARPTWKPMHLQPLYAGSRRVGGQVAERVFRTGVCLPSGSGLSNEDVARVVDALRDVPSKHRRPV